MAPKVQRRLIPNGETPLVVTMGLENFEFHPEGHRSRIVHEFIRQRRDGRSWYIGVVQGAHVIKEALKASRPEMFRWRRIVLIDCRALNDPQATQHIGVHPRILDACARHKAIRDTAKVIGYGARRAMSDGVPVAYVCICKSGRHRSVAVSKGLLWVFAGHERDWRRREPLGPRMGSTDLWRSMFGVHVLPYLRPRHG